MIHRLRTAAALLLVSVLSIAGCGDSTGPGDGAAMSFRFSGALSGRFPDGGAIVRTFNTKYCTLVGVFAVQNQPTGSYSMGLRVNVSAPGTYALGRDGRTGRGSATFQATPAGELTERVYVSTSGSVEFTELSPTRARGRFAATLEDGEGGQIQVTEGRFDMELDDLCEES